MSLTCTFLENCGLYLQTEHNGILVDCPSGLHTQFDGTPLSETEKMNSGLKPYHKLTALFFTHSHADHFDRKRVRELCDSRRELIFFCPERSSPENGIITAGDFSLHYWNVPHSGEEFKDVAHRVYLIQAEGKRVYISGDSDFRSPIHRCILAEFHPDLALWNPNFVSHEEGRRLMALAGKNYINHLSIFSADCFGVTRKCHTCFRRYGDELQNASMVTEIPTQITL